jgi:hypothetical protein
VMLSPRKGRRGAVPSKARLGNNQERVTSIEAGDRRLEGAGGRHLAWPCIFHFLAAAADRYRYMERLGCAVKSGGAVIMATFALDGPETCSGLPVMRHSSETLSAQLDSAFRVVESAHEMHPTPFGTAQSFCYSGSLAFENRTRVRRKTR